MVVVYRGGKRDGPLPLQIEVCATLLLVLGGAVAAPALRAALPRSWPLLAPSHDADLGSFLGHFDKVHQWVASTPATSGRDDGDGGDGSSGGVEDGGDEGALRAELAIARARLREMLLTVDMGVDCKKRCGAL